MDLTSILPQLRPYVEDICSALCQDNHQKSRPKNYRANSEIHRIHLRYRNWELAPTTHQMSALPASALGRPHSSAGSISNAPVSPVSSKGKRKRVHDLHSSPGSGEDGYEAANGERKRQPGVKRACNECRQQKVRSTTRLDNAA